MNETYESVDRMVSHPGHYQSKNGIECIDCIEAAVEGLSGIEAVDTANAIKYLFRWKKRTDGRMSRKHYGTYRIYSRISNPKKTKHSPTQNEVNK